MSSNYYGLRDEIMALPDYTNLNDKQIGIIAALEATLGNEDEVLAYLLEHSDEFMEAK